MTAFIFQTGQRKKTHYPTDVYISKPIMRSIKLIFIKSRHLCICKIKDYYDSAIIYIALEVANSNLQTTEAITVQITQMVQQTKHLRKWFFH